MQPASQEVRIAGKTWKRENPENEVVGFKRAWKGAQILFSHTGIPAVPKTLL